MKAKSDKRDLKSARVKLATCEIAKRNELKIERGTIESVLSRIIDFE